MKKIILLLAIIFLSLSATGVKADIAERSDDFVYVLHLFYDGKTLVLDKTAQYPYDIVADLFLQSSNTGVPFKGRILSVKGETLKEFNFNIPDQKGKVLVRAPYFANAGDVVFTDATDHEVAKVSVAESSFCNNDNVCNADVGEDWKNCRSDCAQPSVSFPSVSPSVIPTQVSEEASLTPFIFIGVFLLVGIIVAFFMFRSRNTSMPL